MAERRDPTGKRAVDVVVAALGLVVTSPLLLALAIAVRATSPGPALHRAVRVGRGGAPFTLYKFRSMHLGASTSGPAVTAGGDSRITRVGGFMRATKLDELPQLLNVLRGDMSIVGPRPEDARYVEWYAPAQREILSWRPGITSPASIAYRDEERVLAGATDLDAAYREIMAAKIALDLEYFPNASLLGDARLVLRTVTAVVRR